jgi:hypothetical protein
MSAQLIRQFSSDAISRLQSNHLSWQHLTGSPNSIIQSTIPWRSPALIERLA